MRVLELLLIEAICILDAYPSTPPHSEPVRASIDLVQMGFSPPKVYQSDKQVFRELTFLMQDSGSRMTFINEKIGRASCRERV